MGQLMIVLCSGRLSFFVGMMWIESGESSGTNTPEFRRAINRGKARTAPVSVGSHIRVNFDPLSPHRPARLHALSSWLASGGLPLAGLCPLAACTMRARLSTLTRALLALLGLYCELRGTATGAGILDYRTRPP